MVEMGAGGGSENVDKQDSDFSWLLAGTLLVLEADSDANAETEFFKVGWPVAGVDADVKKLLIG